MSVDPQWKGQQTLTQTNVVHSSSQLTYQKKQKSPTELQDSPFCRISICHLSPCLKVDGTGRERSDHLALARGSSAWVFTYTKETLSET